MCSCRFVSGETWKSNRSMLFSVELGAMTIAVPPSLGSGKKKTGKLQLPYLAALVQYTLGNIILLSNLLVGVYHQNLRSGFIIRCSSRKEAQQHWPISWQDTINSWNERPALEHVSLSNLVNCLLLFLFSMTLLENRNPFNPLSFRRLTAKQAIIEGYRFLGTRNFL